MIEMKWAKMSPTPFGEWWMGFSFYVQNPMGGSRIMYQHRVLLQVVALQLMPLSLRQVS